MKSVINRWRGVCVCVFSIANDIVYRDPSFVLMHVTFMLIKANMPATRVNEQRLIYPLYSLERLW